MTEEDKNTVQKTTSEEKKSQIQKDKIVSSDRSIYDVIRTKLDWCIELWEQLKELSMNKQSDLMKLLNIAEILKTSGFLNCALDTEKIKKLRPEDEYVKYIDEDLDYRVYFEQVKGDCMGSLMREMDILREKIRFLERLGEAGME